MKKIYIAFLAFTPILAFSQPILTETNMRPVIGQTYKYARFEWTGITPTEGEDQVWDFSTIISLHTDDYECVPVDETPDYLWFDGSNVVIKSIPEDGGYEHFSFSAEQAERYGFVLGDDYFYIYHNPKKYLEFPFTYGGSFTDNYSASYNTPEPEFDLSYTGVVDVSAVGYGTLKLPDGVLNNVLYVVEEDIRTELDDDGFGTDVESELIRFYTPGIHFAVLILFRSPSGDNIGWFFNDPTLFVDPIEENPFAVFPNPVEDELFIQYENTGEVPIIKLYNPSGQLIMESSSEMIQSIDMSDLSPGLYFLQMSIGEKEVMQKIMKR